MLQKLKSNLRYLFFIYGLASLLLYGSMIVGAYVHDDLIITKGVFRLEWILGEINLILLVLWSLFIMLSPLNSKLFGILSLLWAFGISILVVCSGIMNINEGVEAYGGLRGLLFGLFFSLTLYIFPSLGVLIAHIYAGSCRAK